MKQNNQLYLIRFCEPYIQANEAFMSFDFYVTPNFFKILHETPKSYQNDVANAYIFGPQFSINEYIKIGSHENDGGQTGLIDITNATKEELDKIVNDDEIWENAYHGFSKPWGWKPGLLKVRKDISSRILFVGNTDGGDVGANLYAHYNKEKNIDGLIIDNAYFFPEE